MKRNQIGVQLYTLREMAAKDFEATLATVGKMGYAGVEFAGFHGHSAQDVRMMLDTYGLKAFSAHIGIDAFDGDIDRLLLAAHPSVANDDTHNRKTPMAARR